MGKPLLTDEIIEKARQQKNKWDDLEDTKVMPRFSEQVSQYTYDEEFDEDGYDYDEDDERIYKSRRIENTKRNEFQKKLNLVLFIVIALIALLIYAIIKL